MLNAVLQLSFATLIKEMKEQRSAELIIDDLFDSPSYLIHFVDQQQKKEETKERKETIPISFGRDIYMCDVPLDYHKVFQSKFKLKTKTKQKQNKQNKQTKKNKKTKTK